MGKVTTTVSITAEVADKVRVRLVEDRPDGPGRRSMGGAISWIVEQWATNIEAPGPAKPRKIVRRPYPPGPLATPAAEAAAHEGARLRAARVTAGLTQAELADTVSQRREGGEIVVGGGKGISRQQVDRAERAPTLEQWPALRAWLLEREAAS